MSSQVVPMDDRRQEGRTVSVLRVCCIETAQGIGFAMLRNISAHGAQIESDIDDPVGSPISYFFDDSFRIEAEIAWKKDNRIGLANRKVADTNARSFPRRALRVPLAEPGTAWIGGQPYEVNVANISQTGAMLMGDLEFAAGKLITLELGKLVLPNVTIKWSGTKSAGVKFERPLHMRDLKRIVEDRRLRMNGAPGDDGAPVPPRQGNDPLRRIA